MKNLYGIKSELSYPGTYDVLMRRHDFTRTTLPTLLYATKEEAVAALDDKLGELHGSYYSKYPMIKTRISEDKAKVRYRDETTTLEIVKFKLCDD